MRIVYYIFLIPLSIMPFPVLYALSGFAFIMLYYVIGYRKDVVKQNLRNSFPEKSEKEINYITKRYYKHLADLVVESVKIFTISKKQADKRFYATNPEVVNQFCDKGRSVILVGGHYNNWEMYAVAANTPFRLDVYAVYTPIKNKFLDRKMKQTRSKYGLGMVTAREARRVFEDTRDPSKKPIGMILANDQSPANEKKAYWMEFLNQDTGVLFGTERYAQKFNLPVVYGEINKLKRGHYAITYELLTDDPTSLPYGEITERHTRALEKSIRKQPEYWLWSHKRWKKKRPKDANNQQQHTSGRKTASQNAE